MPRPRRTSPQATLIGPKKKIAFVCSGGAAKAGAFHLGVALALQEQGFRFRGGTQAKPSEPLEISTYVGSSAGSIISACLAAGYSINNIFNSFLGREPSALDDTIPRTLPQLTYGKMFKVRPELAGEQLKQLFGARNILKDVVTGNWEALIQMRWLRTTGLFSTKGIEQYMREEVLPTNRFQDYIADLFIVATQLNHSRKVVFGKYRYSPPPHDLTCQYDNDIPISEACAASTALPFIYTPYPIVNKDGTAIDYIDGEIRDTLSTHVAVDAGADLIIASYTHQPYHFTPDFGSLTQMGIPTIMIQSIYLLVEQKINNHIHNKQVQRNAIDAVSRYVKEQAMGDEVRKKIIDILEAELHHRRDVDTIYIHPSPNDTQMFFNDHFTLSPKKLGEIVRSGFRAAIEVLRQHEFADRKNEARAVDVASGQ